MGLVATMSALVLGLLVASAKSSFDARRNELIQMSANVIFLDRVLAHYGPETKEARQQLRDLVGTAVDRIWPKDGSPPLRSEESGKTGALVDGIQGLTPKNEGQRTLQTQAVKILTDLAQTRWLLFSQAESSIPTPFLTVLVFWLALIFASFSLFASPNATVVITLLVCALSVSGAILLILELDRPFGGLIQISSSPLRNALAQLGQ
jgi:hypothetical protein